MASPVCECSYSVLGYGTCSGVRGAQIYAPCRLPVAHVGQFRWWWCQLGLLGKCLQSCRLLCWRCGSRAHPRPCTASHALGTHNTRSRHLLRRGGRAFFQASSTCVAPSLVLCECCIMSYQPSLGLVNLRCSQNIGAKSATSLPIPFMSYTLEMEVNTPSACAQTGVCVHSHTV